MCILVCHLSMYSLPLICTVLLFTQPHLLLCFFYPIPLTAFLRQFYTLKVVGDCNKLHFRCTLKCVFAESLAHNTSRNEVLGHSWRILEHFAVVLTKWTSVKSKVTIKSTHLHINPNSGMEDSYHCKHCCLQALTHLVCCLPGINILSVHYHLVITTVTLVWSGSRAPLCLDYREKPTPRLQYQH